MSAARSTTQNRRFDDRGRFAADAYVGQRAAAMKAAAEAKGAEFVLSHLFTRRFGISMGEWRRRNSRSSR